MKKKVLIILSSILLMLSDSVGFGLSARDLKVELQFYTQTYRLNEPISVLINVVNVSGNDASFYISPLIYETFFFEMRTPNNESIPLLDKFQYERRINESSSGEYREIVLKAGEVFSKKIDIIQWFDIKESGYYFIRGLFFPNPSRALTNNYFESFDYKILVKPPLVVEKNLLEHELSNMMIIENNKKLPPYEVIADFLDAKTKKDWNRFLSHVDAERLIHSFGDYHAAYENARSGRYKLEIVEDFKRYLTTYWQDRILSYDIIESKITKDKALVVCDVEFKIRNTSYIHRYEFNLYKNHADQWLVYDYIVLKAK